ncbi:MULTISPECIES: hypothetical protein [unclassified Microbacterium]
MDPIFILAAVIATVIVLLVLGGVIKAAVLSALREHHREINAPAPDANS